MTVTTGERVCPDGCGEEPAGDYKYAGRTDRERETHRARAGRSTRAQEKALAVQLEQARSVLQGRGVDLDAGADVLADGLCRDSETLVAMATVVAATLRESGAEVVLQMRAEHATVVHRLTGERKEAMESVRQAQRSRAALSVHLEAVEDELAAARGEAQARQECEQQLRMALTAAEEQVRRLSDELEQVQAENGGLALQLTAVTAAREAALAESEDLVHRLEQVVDRELHARQDAAALRAELGRVATTMATELAAAATVATAERALAVRDAHAEHRQEIADLRAQVNVLTRHQPQADFPPGLIIARR